MGDGPVSRDVFKIAPYLVISRRMPDSSDEISAHTFHGARFLGNTEGLKIAEDHAVQTTMQDRLTAIC